MDLKLKRADINDIESLYAILVECGKKMHKDLNLNHWDPFVDFATFAQAMQNKKLYGIYQNNTPIGTFNVSTSPRTYYHIGLWSRTGAKALYVGQLATLPNLQRKGYGKWCMAEVEKIAREMECETIRLDIPEKHPWLRSFYEDLGYKACAIVAPNNFNLMCFEKIL